MRYLLDTNIIGNFTKAEPSAQLIAWLAEQADEELFVSSLTIAEIYNGILAKAAGRRRDQLHSWFNGPTGPQAIFAGRILSFDENAAVVWGKLMAEGRSKGRPRSALDTIIAATAVANDCVVVTDNEKDFDGVHILNPLR